MTKYKNKDWLEQEYKVKRRSRESIAEECGVTTRTINDWISRHGVNRDKLSWKELPKDKPYKNEEWLKQKLNDGLSKQEIAEECSVSRKTITKWLRRYALGHNLVKCPNCDKKIFGQLGKHWKGSDCYYPEITERQWEIMTGILMGDGSINFNEENQNPRLRCDMYEPSKEYLEYLTTEEFPNLMTSVKEGEDSENTAKRQRKSGFNNTASSDVISDMYYVMTRRLPQLEVFGTWYEKENGWDFNDIELTPLTLKHYFVADGSWNNSQSADYISFFANNQVDHIDEMKQLFLDVGFEPSNIGIYEREETIDVAFEFSHETSYEMFEYMGEALPGFNYKWPEKYKI